MIEIGPQAGVTGTTLMAAGTNAGVGTGQFTWLAGDGTMPALTAGQPVFVCSKAGGKL